MNEIKCKERGCLLEANKSGYCDRHDANVITKNNGIATILHLVGTILIVLGAIDVILSFISYPFTGLLSSVGVIVVGIVVIGLGEIITLLQKLVNRST